MFEEKSLLPLVHILRMVQRRRRRCCWCVVSVRRERSRAANSGAVARTRERTAAGSTGADLEIGRMSNAER